MIEIQQCLRSDDSGQDLAEYAVLIGLIALAVVVAVAILGSNIAELFATLGSTVSSANIPSGS